jgi:phosphoglycerol transferase
VTIVTLYVTYGLRKANLSYPIQFFGGDANVSVYITKALGEDAFPLNRRVGAPFGLDYSDCYQPDFIHHWILKLLVKITGNPLLTVNIYYLLGFVLIAVSAFYVLRQFRLSTTVALVCAVLYAFIPSHLWRSYYHIFLSQYFLLPLVVLLALRVMSDYPGEHEPGERSAPLNTRSEPRNPTIKFLLFAVVLGILVGGTGVYYAFYSILLLGSAAFYAAFRLGRKRYSALAVVCAAIIGATTIYGMRPIFRYRSQHGSNPEVAHRTVYDTELYSLQLAELYLPSPFHPITKLRELSVKYADSVPAMNKNESQFSSLGIVGAIGFTTLLFWPFFREHVRKEKVMKCLAVLNLITLLYASTGGFGTLFSFLITPEIRANNRIVFFVAFFALFAFGFALDRLIRIWTRRYGKRSILLWNSAAVLILIVGLYDLGITQVRATVLSGRASDRASYDSNKRFIQRIESQFPSGGNVLQLPYQPFPEMPGVYHMGNYDQLKAYIHSTKLRWSFPAMRGRQGDQWIRDLSSAPVPELVRRAVLAGFCGIYIDRDGYPDAAAVLESQLQAITGAKPVISDDYKLSFFTLTPYAAALRRETSLGQWNELKSKVEEKPRLALTFLSGVYNPETDGSHEWRWCSQTGRLGIVNYTNKVQSVEFTGELSTAFPEKSIVIFYNSTQTFKVTATSKGNTFDWRLVVQPGLNQINFNTDAPRVPAVGDMRELYFRMEHFKVIEP